MSFEVTEKTRVEIRGAKPFVLRPGHVIADELARKFGLVTEKPARVAPRRPAGATPPRARGGR